MFVRPIIGLLTVLVLAVACTRGASGNEDTQQECTPTVIYAGETYSGYAPAEAGDLGADLIEPAQLAACIDVGERPAGVRSNNDAVQAWKLRGIDPQDAIAIQQGSAFLALVHEELPSPAVKRIGMVLGSSSNG